MAESRVRRTEVRREMRQCVRGALADYYAPVLISYATGRRPGDEISIHTVDGRLIHTRNDVGQRIVKMQLGHPLDL